MTTPDSQVPGLSANVAFVPSELGRKIGELVVTACADLKANPCNVGYIWSVKAAALDQALKAGVRHRDRPAIPRSRSCPTAASPSTRRPSA